MIMRKLTLAMLILGLLSLAACGGGEEGGAAESMSPQDMGKAIVDIYMEGLTTIAGMADNPPPLEEAKATLAALKEDMITRLVEFGRIKEAMDASDKAAVNSALTSAFMHIDQNLFNKYNDTLAHYRSQDMDFANEIASFNIITQYADFDLLKQQEPDEAARLGIQ